MVESSNEIFHTLGKRCTLILKRTWEQDYSVKKKPPHGIALLIVDLFGISSRVIFAA